MANLSDVKAAQAIIIRGKTQRKVLASDFGSGTALNTDLFTFNNLVIGNTYSLDVNLEINIASGQANFGITLGGRNIVNTLNLDGSSGYNITFVAESSTLNYQLLAKSGTWTIKGQVGSSDNTWAVLTEHPYIDETTDFT